MPRDVLEQMAAKLPVISESTPDAMEGARASGERHCSRPGAQMLFHGTGLLRPRLRQLRVSGASATRPGQEAGAAGHQVGWWRALAALSLPGWCRAADHPGRVRR